MDITSFALSIWLAYTLFTKSPVFPKLFQGVMLWALASFLAVTAVSNRLTADAGVPADSYVPIINTVIAAAVWIPYMRLSRRVKNTFVDRTKLADAGAEIFT